MFLDKALLQALIWSLALHVVVLGTFKIRLNDFSEYTPQMQAVDVAVEQDDSIQVTASQEPQDKSLLFLATIDPKDTLPPTKKVIQNLPVSASPKWSYTLYPLEFKLSSELKSLTLLDDGSCLFRKNGPRDTLAKLALTAHHLPIEYKVSVNGQTGKIVAQERQQVLLDKKLQVIGDELMKHVRFKPCQKEQITGTITLVFCCSGDEIGAYLHD